MLAELFDGGINSVKFFYYFTDVIPNKIATPEKKYEIAPSYQITNYNNFFDRYFKIEHTNIDFDLSIDIKRSQLPELKNWLVYCYTTDDKVFHNLSCNKLDESYKDGVSCREYILKHFEHFEQCTTIESMRLKRLLTFG